MGSRSSRGKGKNLLLYANNIIKFMHEQEGKDGYTSHSSSAPDETIILNYGVINYRILLYHILTLSIHFMLILI